MAVEIILAPALIFDIMAEAAAYLACFYLMIAAIANFKVSRTWLWHIGGSEWAVFWAICCAIVGYYRSEEHTSELQSLMRISYAVFCLQKKPTPPSVHRQITNGH